MRISASDELPCSYDLFYLILQLASFDLINKSLVLRLTLLDVALSKAFVKDWEVGPKDMLSEPEIEHIKPCH